MAIRKSDLPVLQGTSLTDAKTWFNGLRPHKSGVQLPGWHADDGFEGNDDFSEGAAAAINETVATIFENAREWPDADVVYRLVAGEAVLAESIWPGFVADIETSASRIGYVSVPQREKPNFVIEDYSGEFYLLEFEGPKLMSECRAFTMARLDGVSFQTGSSADAYVDVRGASLIEGTEVNFDDIGLAEQVLQSIHASTTPSGPTH